MIITELSPTVNGTGIPSETGSVSESLLKHGYNTVERCPNPGVYRLDRSTGSLSIIEDTANAISATANAFTPFNSDGDEFAISCDEDFQGVLFRLDTQGNHSATLTVKDSTDGVWASNTLMVTDESNAFEAAAGWHYITIPDNAGRAAFRLSNDPILNTPSRKYVLFRLGGLAGGDILPKLSNLVLIRKTFRVEDHTVDFNGDKATAPPVDTHYPWPGSYWMWGFNNPSYGAEAYMHLAANNVITDAHEYLADDGNWKPLSGWVNNTNDFTAGPTVLGNPVEKFTLRFTIPADWAERSQTVTLDNGSTATVSAYWIRERTLTVTSYGSHIQARYRIRARQFGNTSTTGIEPLVQEIIRGVRLLSATIPNATAIECEAVNMTTGQTSAFTIPANPAFPVNVDFADLTISPGQRYSIVAKSGGTARNLQLEFVQ